MALNTLKCNHLTPLGFKGLKWLHATVHNVPWSLTIFQIPRMRDVDSATASAQQIVCCADANGEGCPSVHCDILYLFFNLPSVCSDVKCMDIILVLNSIYTPKFNLGILSFLSNRVEKTALSPTHPCTQLAYFMPSEAQLLLRKSRCIAATKRVVCVYL